MPVIVSHHTVDRTAAEKAEAALQREGFETRRFELGEHHSHQELVELVFAEAWALVIPISLETPDEVVLQQELIPDVLLAENVPRMGGSHRVPIYWLRLDTGAKRPRAGMIIDIFPSWRASFPQVIERLAEFRVRAITRQRPTVLLAWDPSVLTVQEYAELVLLLGDLARSAGAAGVIRLRSMPARVDAAVSTAV